MRSISVLSNFVVYTVRHIFAQTYSYRFRDILDKWMVLHLIAIIFCSLAAGIVFMHTGFLWAQYVNGRAHRSTLGEIYVMQDSVSVFRSPASEQCKDDHRQQQLVVNTSMYFW